MVNKTVQRRKSMDDYKKIYANKNNKLIQKRVLFKIRRNNRIGKTLIKQKR
jgi:hypothetical protein